MTKFLWTGESEFCICGHHITDHDSHVNVVLTDDGPVFVTCNGTKKAIAKAKTNEKNRRSLLHDYYYTVLDIDVIRCRCKGFKPFIYFFGTI